MCLYDRAYLTREDAQKLTTGIDYDNDNDEDECRHLVNGITTPAALPCHLFVQSCLSAITGRRTDKGARPNFTSHSLSYSLQKLSSISTVK